MGTAREALVQKIVDEGCGGCSMADLEDGHDVNDNGYCVKCDCWAHVAERALKEWDYDRFVLEGLRK